MALQNEIDLGIDASEIDVSNISGERMISRPHQCPPGMYWDRIKGCVSIDDDSDFMGTKKLNTQNQRIIGGGGGCRDSRDCGFEKHCEDGKCVSDLSFQRKFK